MRGDWGRGGVTSSYLRGGFFGSERADWAFVGMWDGPEGRGFIGKVTYYSPKGNAQSHKPLHPWISPPRLDTLTPATHPGLLHAMCPTPCRIEISVEEMQTSGGAICWPCSLSSTGCVTYTKDGVWMGMAHSQHLVSAGQQGRQRSPSAISWRRLLPPVVENSAEQVQGAGGTRLGGHCGSVRLYRLQSLSWEHF